MKIRLDFCDFWPGFCKNDNFIYNVLKQRFDIQLCDQPDYIIFGDLGSHMHRLHNCVKIYFCPEDFPPDFTQYDYALTTRYLDDPRHLRMPYYVPHSNPAALIKENESAEQILASKTKFCSFLVSYANRKTRVRNNFFERLCKYKKVDSGGRMLNNIGYRVPHGIQAKQDFLAPYKFNLAFENASVVGYTTEKITDAMKARSLPIYWGNPRVGEEFNSKSFLNYHDFPSEEALIEKIIELDKDDAKYLEYARQPYHKNNVPNEYFSRERMLNFFERIFTEKIQPVAQRRSFFHFGRWIAAKRNKLHYRV